jgi:glycosyltransferase involved in cell wall biosynthesis
MKTVVLVNEALSGGVLRVAEKETLNLNLLGVESVLAGSSIPNFDNQYDVKIRNVEKSRSQNAILAGYGAFFSRNVFGRAIFPNFSQNFLPDWIICHNLHPIFWAHKLARNNFSKICLVIHNPSFPPSPLSFFLRPFGLERHIYKKQIGKILENVDVVLTTSSTLSCAFYRDFGVPSKVLPLACDPSDEIPVSRGDFILCASRISLGKKVDHVAEMIGKVDRNFPVVFAGSTHATSKEVVKRIGKSGLRNYKIIFNLSDAELNALYSRCRFFMAFSSGLPPLEAASHGAPIICDKNSWANEYFKDGIHGYLYKSDDDLASRCPSDIKSLLLDERKAWKMGYQAWRLCIERYTWRHHVENLLSALDVQERRSVLNEVAR